MKTIKITSTAYSEYCSYIGKERQASFPDEWAATQWLVEMLGSGEYKLSSASIVTMADVERHRKCGK